MAPPRYKLAFPSFRNGHSTSNSNYIYKNTVSICLSQYHRSILKLNYSYKIPFMTLQA